MDINYNNYDKRKKQNNKIIPSFEKTPNIKNIPSSEHMPEIDKKRPVWYNYETKEGNLLEENNMPVNDQHIHTKEQTRPKWPSYKPEEYLMADPNFRKYVKEYHATTFYAN